MTKKEITELLSFLPQFETEPASAFFQWGEKDEDGELCVHSYPQYTSKMRDFVDAAYDSGLLRWDYQTVIEKAQGSEEYVSDLIEGADFPLICAILSFYVMGEKDCEGLWASAVFDKIFQKILYRIQEIESNI